MPDWIENIFDKLEDFQDKYEWLPLILSSIALVVAIVKAYL